MIDPARAAAAAYIVAALTCVSSCGGASSEAQADETSQEPRVTLVTGSTGGLGREVARRLAADGAHVIVHGRDEARGRSLVEEIEASGAGSARFYRADFASLDGVRALADAIRRDYDRLDVLVNNAGILVSPDARPLSRDGHELHFQVNYLAGFLLTRLLLPMLEAAAPSRIVNVSSLSSAPLDFDDVMLERGYSSGRAYGQSKLAQIMFTLELATRLEGSGVTVDAIHPATFMDTGLVRGFGGTPRTTVDEGAEAVVGLVDPAEPGSGRFFNGLSPFRAHPQAYDRVARERLWMLSERLTGLSDPPR